jgi:1-aminocyclopropane-1-carboxylate deaminase
MSDSPLPPYITKLRSIPKESFLFGPSPIHHLPTLTRHLSPTGSNIQIYAKREDCNSGLAYGGNKVRKLQYLVADALAHHATHLVSVGGVQSNHTRAVAAVAAARGLAARTLQEHWVPIAPPLYDAVGNILLSRLLGADVRLHPDAPFDIGSHAGAGAAVAEIDAAPAPAKAYFIPPGASDHPLGGLGFVDFVVELAAQERDPVAALPFLDTLVVCSVTGSSQAGLVVGAVAEGRGRRVIGVDASGDPEKTRAQVWKIARATAALLDPGLVIPEESVVVDGRFHEGVYGVPGPGTIAAMKVAARMEAMITDPVYEGKSMAGLMQLVREGSIAEGSNVLYVHLGGQPALNAYSSYFDDEALK